MKNYFRDYMSSAYGSKDLEVVTVSESLLQRSVP